MNENACTFQNPEYTILMKCIIYGKIIQMVSLVLMDVKNKLKSFEFWQDVWYITEAITVIAYEGECCGKKMEN